MSYIEKEKLIKADIAGIENKVRHAFNQGYDLGYKEGKSNIDKINKENYELAEQEPILDKLRAEILEEHENAYAREDYDTAYGLSVALDIIDKYKAESEDK